MTARTFELAVAVDPRDHNLGASHAPVTVVEYGDFECPNCKQAAPAVKLLLERFPGRVREDIEGGRASGVRGTPTFFLNGAVQDVSFGLQRLFEKVQAELPR